jgi:hypothetical protein
MLASPLLAALALSAAPGPTTEDPCRAAAAPLSRPADVPRDVFRAVETYRAAWRRACDPSGSPDLAPLLGDAEALALDARTSRIVRILAAEAIEHGREWPLPGIRWVDGDLAVDWKVFALLAPRGKVEDVRFWRGASVAANRFGDPAWLDPVADAPGAECVLLGETRWADVARGIAEMEAAAAPQYASHARELRRRLADTLEPLARGAPVCGCVRGDAGAGLAELAAVEPGDKRNENALRVQRSATLALDALRAGRAKVRWLRQAPGGEPTGCRGGP